MTTEVLRTEAPEAAEEQYARRTPVAVARPVDLSVIVVTWNSARWIRRCLRSIAAAADGLRCEVLVYDNGSADDTLHVMQGEGVRVLSSGTNDGFAAATNRAVDVTSGRYVFLLNPDCELAPGAIGVLFDFLESHRDVAAAVPLLTDDAGQPQREFQLRRIPTLSTFVLQALAVDKLVPANRWTAHYRCRDLDLSAPVRVEQPAAAAMLIRRDAFAAVGAFDEQFSPAWFEDVDFCRRLAGAGMSIYVVPAAQARHFGGASLEHLGLARFLDLWYSNMWRYAKKWFAPSQTEALRWAIIAGMVLRLPAAIAGIAHGDAGRWNALRAYVAVLKKAFHRWDESPASSW